jgi:hypothetical protein
MVDYYEHGKESASSIKGGVFLEQLVLEDSAPCS